MAFAGRSFFLDFVEDKEVAIDLDGEEVTGVRRPNPLPTLSDPIGDRASLGRLVGRNQFLATCGPKAEARIFDLETGSLVSIFQLPVPPGGGVRFSSNGDRILVQAGDLTQQAILLACGSPCAFPGADNHCSIYPTRPNCCVGLQAGDEQCQQARAAVGLAPLLPVVAMD